ncbi:MAG: VOC family protein [Chloroflexota bacterium]|nr:MAG: VOC family protein [Chloroflexota bacterium]
MADHPVLHIEFSAADRVAAGEFYRDLFGWEVVQMPEMNYATFSTGEEPGGGFNPISEENPPGTVIAYIGTDDIDASLAKAEALGGKKLMPKTEIPETGWVGLFSDPTGNIVGLYTPLQRAS